MKKSIVFASCLLQLLMLSAQQPVSKFLEVNDSVKAEYNRGDYKAVYERANQIFKELNSLGELTGGLGPNFIKNRSQN
jgi:hypothetical protein